MTVNARPSVSFGPGVIAVAQSAIVNACPTTATTSGPFVKAGGSFTFWMVIGRDADADIGPPVPCIPRSSISTSIAAAPKVSGVGLNSSVWSTALRSNG